MDELKLEDLVFDSGAEVFDAFKSTKPTDGAKPADVVIADPTTQKEIKPSGEETKSPESVATKEENKDTDTIGKAPEVKDAGGDTSSPNDTEKLYSSLAAEFKAKGVLPGLDLENTQIKSMDDIEKAITAEVESRLDTRQKSIAEAISAGVPANEANEQLAMITRLKEIPETFIADENNAAFRLNLMTQDFINKGYEKDRAGIMAQRSIDAGTDVEDANFALKAIIKHEDESYNSLIDNARATEEKNISGIKDYISKEDFKVGDIKLSHVQKDELYKQMTTDLGNKENAFMQAQKEDPMGSRVKLEAIFYLTKGFKDWSAFSKASETKASNGIESLLRGHSFTEDGKVQTETKDSQSSFSLKDLEGLEF